MQSVMAKFPRWNQTQGEKNTQFSEESTDSSSLQSTIGIKLVLRCKIVGLHVWQ